MVAVIVMEPGVWREIKSHSFIQAVVIEEPLMLQGTGWMGCVIAVRHAGRPFVLNSKENVNKDGGIHYV